MCRNEAITAQLCEDIFQQVFILFVMNLRYSCRRRGLHHSTTVSQLDNPTTITIMTDISFYSVLIVLMLDIIYSLPWFLKDFQILEPRTSTGLDFGVPLDSKHILKQRDSIQRTLFTQTYSYADDIHGCLHHAPVALGYWLITRVRSDAGNGHSCWNTSRKICHPLAQNTSYCLWYNCTVYCVHIYIYGNYSKTLTSTRTKATSAIFRLARSSYKVW